MGKRTRSTELAALTAIAAQVNCTQDLDEILTNALKTTLDVIGEDSGEIFLVDVDNDQLALFVHQGVSAGFVRDEASIVRNECLCGLAFESRLPVIISDMAAHPARSRTACLREGFQSCIRLPILARGEALGLLNIQSKEERVFTSGDQELLTAIANQIGIAIANAQLIDDAEQRRATLDSVMNSLVDGLILLDKSGKIAYANPCSEGILNLAARELYGQTLDAMEHGIAGRALEPEAVLAEFESALAAVQKTPVVEFPLSGSPVRMLQVRFFPINDQGGGHLGTGLLLRDITREKELDQMKSQLLSTVSHELRTPLASIKGFATTLLREDVSWDEESRREFLSIIDKESDRLSELIANLLDMSRVEAGILRVDPEPADLGPIIKETATDFQRMTRTHRILADVPASPPLVMADRRRTRQVLRNLVENAVKYSPDGGEININMEAQGDYLQVSVADQGIGIEPQQLEHVFDRFYQVDSASTRNVGGSGLGLSICKAIIEAHGGEIWVESATRAGSTFYFTLPLIHQRSDLSMEDYDV